MNYKRGGHSVMVKMFMNGASVVDKNHMTVINKLKDIYADAAITILYKNPIKSQKKVLLKDTKKDH